MSREQRVSYRHLDGAVEAFTFRLSFRFYDLECWRELRVPKSFSFEDFHTAIQACLSWLNYHLYDFKYTSRGEKWQVSWPSFETGGNPLEDFDYWLDTRKQPAWADAATVRLDEVFPRTRTALYSYDYGDGWEIDVKLVDSKTPLPNGNPLCVAGEGDNPPEDVGAEWGFVEFLQAIANPDDPEHDHMIAWGEGQAFEHFDIASTNMRLARYDDWRVQDVYGKPEREAGATQPFSPAAPSRRGVAYPGPTAYHKGALAGLPEEERREAVDSHVGEPSDDGLFDFALDDPVSILLSVSRRGAPRFTLPELLAPLKKGEIAGIASSMGFEGAAKLKKAELIERVSEMLRNPEGFGVFVDSVPLAFLDTLQRIVDADGRLYIPEGKAESLDDVMPPHEPILFLYHTGRCFAYVIPDELIGLARSIDWEGKRRAAEQRVKLRKLATACVELRGIVPVYEFLEECKALYPDLPSDDEVVKMAVQAACATPLFTFLVTEDDSFMLDADLANTYLENAAEARVDPGAPFIEGSLDPSLVALLALQGDEEPRPVPPEALEYPLAALWREDLPAARDLRNWLDEHVPDGADDYRFADTMISLFCDEAKWGDAGEAATAPYFGMLADEGLVLDDEDSKLFADLLAAFVNAQPTWPRNGWSADELAKRRGADALAGRGRFQEPART